MVFTMGLTKLTQTLACVVPGRTLHFRYRSGWSDAEGGAGVEICRKQPSGSQCQSMYLLTAQSTWLSQSIPLTITATEIELDFYIYRDTTQWLDIDDVYID